MFMLYDLFFLIFSICYLPVFLFRKKMHPGFSMRLGILPKDLKFDRPIWIHAVSVGEAISVKHLIEDLRQALPNKKFVISTVTATGNKIANGIVEKKDFVTYLPLDFSFIVKRAITRINPSVFVITETEIWPNLIRCLHKKKIPIVLVNGRISDASYRGYSIIKLFLAPVLNKIDAFCVQSEHDRQRLLRLGARDDKIKVTGNMKFDIKIRDYDELRKDYTDYRQRLGLEAKDRLLIAASTHRGEEEIALKVFNELCREYPNLKMLIAPRHPERIDEVEKSILDSGFRAVRISKLADKVGTTPVQLHEKDKKIIFILDTVGQLMYFYVLSDIVFVGGSLVKKGGHNIIEPASLSKPVIFGPHMFNFSEITSLFLKEKSGIMVNDESELKTCLKDFLGKDAKISEFGRSAKDIILKNKGATERNKQAIIDLLKQ
jgi:3-deoxy-D-manno-octulosonic-acid transferase